MIRITLPAYRKHNRIAQQLGLLLAMLLLTAACWAKEEITIEPSWTSVTVAVADLDRALELWVGTFGFSKLASAQGDDAELAALWRILPADIKRQALLGIPGSVYGNLHLVEFTEPGPPVREGAQVYDLGPGNLTVFAKDLPARVKEMQAKGISFRHAEPTEFTTPDGAVFSEIHLLAQDEVNIVLREIIGKKMVFSPQGFTGIGRLTAVVDDAQSERDFYAELMDMDLLYDSVLGGPDIERTVGLPAGVKLEQSIWGIASESLGQTELVDYQGVKSTNLYPITVPTQLGILHASYRVRNLDVFKKNLHNAGINHSERDFREVIFGSGRFIRFRTPAGMNIEAFEQ